MEIRLDDKRRIAEVWLTSSDQQNNFLQADLNRLYSSLHKDNYLVAVYRSGRGDLYQSTLDLLTYNKRRIAELTVRIDKRRQAAAMER